MSLDYFPFISEIEYTPAWFPYLEYSIISLVGILLLVIIACVSVRVVRACGRSRKKKKDVQYQNKHGATNGRRSYKKNSIMPKSMDFQSLLIYMYLGCFFQPATKIYKNNLQYIATFGRKVSYSQPVSRNWLFHYVITKIKNSQLDTSNCLLVVKKRGFFLKKKTSRAGS